MTVVSSQWRLAIGVLLVGLAVLNAAQGEVGIALLFALAAAFWLVGLVGLRRTRIEIQDDVLVYQPSYGAERMMAKADCDHVRIIGNARRAMAQLHARDGARFNVPLIGEQATKLPEHLRATGWPVEDARR